MTVDDGPVDEGILAGASYPNETDLYAVTNDRPRDPNRAWTCPACRFTYIPAIPENWRTHRWFHDKWMKPRRPKPDRRFAANTDIIVDKASPKWTHKLVYERAQALRRDQHYDFVQWGEDHAPSPCTKGGRIHAILLIESSTPIGVVGFEFTRQRDKAGEGEWGWHMTMAWIAEPWRRKGMLSRRWPQWLAAYGAFTVERPVSGAMARFLDKHGVRGTEEELLKGTQL